MAIAWKPVAEVFRVVYAGPAVDDTTATIDASVLGSSLVALTDLIDSAQEVLHPDGPGYRIKVKSTGRGSFSVELVAELWDSVVNLLSHRNVETVKDLMLIFTGLVQLMRALRGRSPSRIEERANGFVIHVEGEEIEVERQVGNLWRSKRVRNAFRLFVRPVSGNEINAMRVELPSGDSTTFTPEDRPSFDAPLDEETVIDQTVQMRLRVETIRWRTGRWEFSTPETGIFWASIEDDAFLTRVDQRVESFDKGDLLEAEVRIRQWDEGDGSYRTERVVTSVMRHLKGDMGQQLAWTPDPPSLGGE